MARAPKVACVFVATLFVIACCELSYGAEEARRAELKSAVGVGDLANIEIQFEAGGKLQVTSGQTPKLLPMRVVSQIRYEEKLLAGGIRTTAHLRSARSYEQATAEITIDKATSNSQLRTSHQLVLVDAGADGIEYSSPVGPLTADELDLLELPGNSLLLERLLPDHPVAQGDQWEQPAELFRDLLGLDAVAASQVLSELVELTESAAKMQFTGQVQGAIDGVATDIEVKAKFKFDRRAGRVTWFALLVKEKHAPGHVSPGVDATAKILMKLVPKPQAERLTAEVIDQLPAPEQAERRLAFETPKAGFRFQYDPNWHVMSEDAKEVALRLVDRGDLISQCNVTMLDPLPADKASSLTDFQDDVRQALGERFGSFLKASESTQSNGNLVYRVEAAGTVSELPIHWRYYLVRDAAGRRLALVFTCQADLADKLGDADQRLVGSVELLDSKVQAAAQPSGSTSR